MDESHILVGLEEGGVVCVLQANNHQRFATENLSESGITAVLCDNFDVKGETFYNNSVGMWAEQKLLGCYNQVIPVIGSL